MATNYSRGADFERRVRSDMERRGWFAVRSPGSKGHADVVAIGRGETLAIQCKTGGRCGPREWNDLIEFAHRYGMLPVLAHKDKRGHVKYRLITACKGGRKRIEDVSVEFEPRDWSGE